MNRLLQRTITVASIGGIGIFLLAAMCGIAGARLNVTSSLPVGLYWVSAAPIAKGVYVMFCPPQRHAFAVAKKRYYIESGRCPGGYGYMMKRVLAVADDTFSVTDDGVRVNGEPIPNSVPLAADGAGRPLPRYRCERCTLDRSQLLLMSGVNPISYDARYFGPVDRAQIRSVVRPIFTW